MLLYLMHFLLVMRRLHFHLHRHGHLGALSVNLYYTLSNGARDHYSELLLVHMPCSALVCGRTALRPSVLLLVANKPCSLDVAIFIL